MAKTFALDVQKFAEQFNEGAEEAVRGVTIKLWSAVIKTSPVGDIDGGRFRGNWFPSDAQPSSKVDLSARDKSGSKSISSATQFVNGAADWSAFTLTNNLPYSEVIEFGQYGDGPNTVGGFSKKAPQGVVRVNVDRSRSELEVEANKRLPK